MEDVRALKTSRDAWSLRAAAKEKQLQHRTRQLKTWCTIWGALSATLAVWVVLLGTGWVS